MRVESSVLDHSFNAHCKVSPMRKFVLPLLKHYNLLENEEIQYLATFFDLDYDYICFETDFTQKIIFIQLLVPDFLLSEAVKIVFTMYLWGVGSPI